MATRTVPRNRLSFAQSENGQHMKMNARQETITPSKAVAYLQHNTANRPLMDHYVMILAEAIVSGEWQCNGEPIIFADDGTLLDGQHRLSACVQAGQPIVCFVVRGASRDAFKTIDRGKIRPNGTILGMAGEKNATVVAAACGWVWSYTQGKMLHHRGRNLRPAQVFDVLAKHPGIRDSADIASRLRKLWAPGPACFCHYIFSRVDREAADAFFDHLLTGENLGPTSPIYRLRENLIDERCAKAKLPPHQFIAEAIKAWNHHRAKKPLKLLKWSVREDFPAVDGLVL